MPQQSIAWNALLLLASLLCPLLLLLVTTALAAAFDVRPRVTVRTDRIWGHDGQRKFFIEAGKLLAAFIYMHSDGKVRLKLRYRGYNRQRVVALGLPSDVDLDALANLLAVKPVIRSRSSRLK